MQEFYFSGTIERIIFENASNFFRILLLEIDETDSDFEDYEIIVTGTMGEVMEGEDYTFWGQLTNHPKYGKQLQMTRYERSKPSASGLIKYFSSDNFKGIGKKTAERIVEIYGEDPIDKILEDPSKLEQIPNLSKVNREAFLAKLKINYGTEQILSKLSSYGLTPKAAAQIFNQYKEESLNLIEKYPYLLVEEVQGIGFKMADQLAERLGIASDAPERLRAALIHCLLEASMEEGDTYIEAKSLLERTIILLESSRQIELDPALVAHQLTNIIQEDKVQNIETKIFDNTLYFAEQGIYTHLTRITKDQPDISAEDKIQASLERVEDELGITYDKVQKDAIIKALQSKVFILTGGPGTGKTTVINGIIKTYADLHGLDLKKSDLPIILAAPTGRAARRMNELTKLPSATIHRHLGLNGEDDFKTLDDYLDCDLIIIDEFSMVDTWLANQLFESISDTTQVIIVGDQDQLPSVGPGQVLADLLQIDDLPKVSLTKIFRQSEDSTIVTLASQMRQGQLPTDFTEKKADRSYFEANANHIPQMVPKIVSAAIKSGIAAQDVQILAPMYRGQAGINNLNTIMQDLLNPKEKANQFAFNDIFFRKNDKILHLVNDTELNVFNGDIGIITDLIPGKYTESKQDEIYMSFDGNEVIYPRNEWNKITLAYAMSIHKSQGSEFPVVILPITRQSGRMLQRNLIYTAITRAKSKLVMLGEIAAFDYAVRNEGAKRNTYLIQRFEQTYTQVVDKSVEKIVKNETTEAPNQTKTKNNYPSETFENKDFSGNINPSPDLVNTYSQPVDKSVNKPVQTEENYRLTEENWATIDPMIGLSEDDIAAFFNNN